MSWDLAVSALHVFLEAAGLPRVHAERLLIDLLDRYSAIVVSADGEVEAPWVLGGHHSGCGIV